MLFEASHLRTILRTVFGTEAETRILPLAFAPLKRLKPSFCRWQFKTVRTVVLKTMDLIRSRSRGARPCAPIEEWPCAPTEEWPCVPTQEWPCAPTEEWPCAPTEEWPCAPTQEWRSYLILIP